MISDGCLDANRKVLIKRVREHLLPTAQTWCSNVPAWVMITVSFLPAWEP
jgi:hypothetical protein